MKIVSCNKELAVSYADIRRSFNERIKTLSDQIRNLHDQINVTQDPRNKGNLRKRIETVRKKKAQLHYQRDAQLLNLRKARMEEST